MSYLKNFVSISLLSLLSASLIVFLVNESAFAHGSMESPLSRVYGCYLEGPESPDSDACRAAIAESGTQGFYDWNEINQLPNGHHQAFVPDGQLCSGGKESHSGLDLARDDWPSQIVNPDADGNFEFVFLATAPHASQAWDFYVTKDDYDPLQTLAWSDLEAAPFCTYGDVPLEDGRYRFSCQLPEGKTGKHIIYNTWQRSDSPEAFYTCMDVEFGNDTVVEPTETSAASTPTTIPPTFTPTPVDPNEPMPEPTVGSGSTCQVDYQITDQWSTGFTADVAVTNNGSAPVNGWKVGWSFPGNQKITSLWNGIPVQNGSGVSVSGPPWSVALAPGGTTSFGFSGSYSGANQIPTAFTLNGAACNGEAPVPPTAVPPTAIPPTAVPPTVVPPTAIPPTAIPPTAIPPTAVPPTAVPPTAVPPTAVPPTAISPTATPEPTTAVPITNSACSVAYIVTGDWGTGFNTDVIITNNKATAINGWNLTWDFGSNQTVSTLWNGTYVQSGSAMSVTNASWTSYIAPNGGSASIGFGASYNGANPMPTNFALNGVACNEDAPIRPTAIPPTDVPPTATPIVVPTSQPTGEPTGEPTVGNKEVVAYFAQWGIYGRDYHVKNIATSGSADKITILNYAFGNVVNGECIMTTQTGVMDAYADYQKSYTAAQSVDGAADVWNQPLRGNFNQLIKLKVANPQMKVMISLGGWTWSAGFHEAAKTAASRQQLVQSCIDIYIRGNLPVADNAGGAGVAAGLFDGIDVDWEYPGNPGIGNPYGPEDTRNFTLLLQEFRSQLDAINPNLMLTIATGAGVDKYSHLELGQIHQSLDYINIMTYDLHGAWEDTTGFHAPLYASANAPYSYPSSTYSVDSAVQGYISAGVPAEKIIMGVPFYGRGWRGVGSSSNNGLWQSASGAATGTYEAGIEDYKVLKELNYPVYEDADSGAKWIYNGDIFWSYDDEETLTNKMAYIYRHNLAGAMVWALDGDDASGTLMHAVSDGLQAASDGIFRADPLSIDQAGVQAGEQSAAQVIFVPLVLK